MQSLLAHVLKNYILMHLVFSLQTVGEALAYFDE